MADIKNLLKEARKLIDDKQFQEAQECCKDILRKDKDNYLALVLLGKSFQDTEQAPLAFQKAVSSKPDHILAWQGLASYYEKKDDKSSKIKLLQIYQEILPLLNETDKAMEVIHKIGKLGVALKCEECVGFMLRYILIHEDQKLKEAASEKLLELLISDIYCKQDDIPDVLTILNELHDKNPAQIELLSAKLIIQKHSFVSAVEDIINHTFFSYNATIREWLCIQLCQKFIKENNFCGLIIDEVFTKATSGIENSKAANLLKSMICYERSQYIDAYKIVVPLINYNQPEVTESVFILKCTVKLKKWSVVQKLAMNFLTKTNDASFTIKLKKFLFMALAKQEKWKQAVNSVKDIHTALDISEKAVLVECLIQLDESHDEFMEEMKDTTFYSNLKALQLLKHNKYTDIVSLLSDTTDDALSLFYLGKAYWKLNIYDKCHVSLIKAAKLNPENGNIFFYLGHFYRFYIQDLEKAKKCYEKAYALKDFDHNIAKNLSDVFSELELKDSDFHLLNSLLLNMQTNESWVHFRLGLHYLRKRDWENAITSFRNVIKSDHYNATAFECLADSYYSRGSYTSSLRAYQKVMVLDKNKALHCETRIGYIHSLLTEYDKAISVFQRVLQMDPNSALALKGISETWMRVSKQKLATKLYGNARDCAQQAVDYLIKALKTYKNYKCLWKNLGDTLLFITKLPKMYSYVYMDASFSKDNNEIVTKYKLEIYPQAIACYSHLSKQKHQPTAYDLAASYLAYYRQSNKEVHCQISYNLCITAIKKKPNVWRYWDLLGKICCYIKKFNRAQHCFIKALMVTKKWSVAKIWCNLGTLYLKLKYYKLANYCFWRGQSTLPSYPQSWIGQALIAEAIKEEEAMDLFRHASRLGYHPESALGYADWVCRTLKNTKSNDPELKYVIEALYAVPYSIDLIEWYTVYESKNANAFIILGTLQERFGLLNSAFSSYVKALECVGEDKKNIVLLNMGRILLRLQKYDESFKCYKAITEASLDSACGLALALFKKGNYEEAYSAYDTALHWLSNEDVEKADLLVAMAGIMYMFKGPDDAKTLLFHSIQISAKKPSIYSLFAICSLGLLHSDQSLSKLALSELQKYEKDYEFSYDIGFLKSYILVCEENIEKAIKTLSETIHDHPNNALLWYCMSQYCLRESDKKATLASSCALKALCSIRTAKLKWEPAKIIATSSVATHIAGNKIKAFKIAKEGFHVYPQQADIWAALVFSLMASDVYSEKKKLIASTLNYMRRHLEIPRQLSRWVSIIEKKVAAA